MCVANSVLSLSLSRYTTPYAHIDAHTHTHTRNPGDARGRHRGSESTSKKEGQRPKEEKKHWRETGVPLPSLLSRSYVRFFIERILVGGCGMQIDTRVPILVGFLREKIS